MYSSKLRLVLFHRNELKDLEQDPCRSTVLSKLNYDDAGYFIGTRSMYTCQWQPIHNLYETESYIQIIAELVRFK